ncbi:HAUS augmin-like complex subunit 1 [Meleagris gallopavo]|uniref:HAUS augmin like complex subunit 1 n=1 Tax=Meleagris gallopavo TaxID=9103 RepID=G1MS16_MELGA|nr:HAUS augmin-like complex subunit 1 [Meleagris gallopavo]
MAAFLQEKAERIASWLKKTFENQLVSQLEVNVEIVDLLHMFLEYSEERERNVSFLIEDMKQVAAEYDADAEYLQSLLVESLDLSPSQLSKEGGAHLKTLVDSAMILETKDTSFTSFFCTISDRSLELHAAESENKEMEQELLIFKKKLAVKLLLEERLEKNLDKVKSRLQTEGSKTKSRFLNLKFLKDKCEDLRIRIKTVVKQLAANGINQSLIHESLLGMYEKLFVMQEEMEYLKKDLKCYIDLPPSLSLARVKVEETKRQLSALEVDLSKTVEMLTQDMLETRRL